MSEQELRIAAGIVSDLAWLAGEIAGARGDAQAIERQRRAAGMLFTSLDNPADVPELARRLDEEGIDTEVILRWYAPGHALVEDWESRLAYVSRAVGLLRPLVEEGMAGLDARTRGELDGELARRRAAIDGWIEGPGPWP